MGHRRQTFSDEEYQLFRDYIAERSGLSFDEGKRDSLRIALNARLSSLGLEGYADYYRLLQAAPGELQELLELLVVPETHFFRHPEQFRILGQRIVPLILARKGPGERIRIWSAGCSTGEEPYSIALTLLELHGKLGELRGEILATDLSQRALEAARRGIYRRRSIKHVKDHLLRRFFEAVGDGYRLRDEVKKMVGFDHLNLAEEPFPLWRTRGQDVIFCRNVTIYFRRETVKRIVANLFRSLEPGGYLFIGPSETLWQISKEFELIEVEGVYFYRRPEAPVPLSIPSLPSSPASPVSIAPPEPAEGFPSSKEEGKAGPEALYEEALGLFQAGDYQKALTFLEEALARDPGFWKAHLLAAYILASGGRYEEAQRRCQEALSVDPFLPEAYLLLGLIHRELREEGEAISFWKKALYCDGAFAPARYHLAQLYAIRGEKAKALRAFDEALRALEAGNVSETSTAFGYTWESLIHACQLGKEKVKGTS